MRQPEENRFRLTLYPATRARIERIATARGWETPSGDVRDVARQVITAVLAEAAAEAEIDEITLLSSEETRQLLRSILTARARPISEIERVVRWAEKVRANETLLDGLLLKKFDVVVPADDGELIFKNLEENDGEHTTR